MLDSAARLALLREIRFVRNEVLSYADHCQPAVLLDLPAEDFALEY